MGEISAHMPHGIQLIHAFLHHCQYDVLISKLCYHNIMTYFCRRTYTQQTFHNVFFFFLCWNATLVFLKCTAPIWYTLSNHLWFLLLNE